MAAEDELQLDFAAIKRLIDEAEQRAVNTAETRVLKRVKEGVAYQRHAPQHRDGGSDIAGIIVEEVDGSPSVKNVTRIKVTNGAETDNGDGSVTLNLAGSSTGAAVGDSFITISHDADLTAERTLALTPADGEHTFTDGGANASITLVGVDATATQKGHAILGQPMGLTGATAATRYVGATASGAPGSGTFAVGDFVIDQTGRSYVCTVAGTPGTWAPTGAGSGDALVTIGHPAGLSAERALALTPADGEHTFTDGGANGSVTLAGVTATTSQKGHAQFDATNPANIGVPAPGSSGIMADRAHVHGTTRGISYTMDGGGATLTTGVRPSFQIPYACTIARWGIQGDAAGTCTIDVTTSSDSATPSYTSIVGAGTKPNVAGPAVGTVSTAPSSWTSTAITARQLMQFNLSAVATFKWLTITLEVTVA